MKTNLFLFGILIISAIASHAQNIQGGLRHGGTSSQVIFVIKNNGSTTITGNLTGIKYTLSFGSGKTPIRRKFLPTYPDPKDVIKDNSYYNFGVKNMQTWTGSLPISLAPGATLDLVEFELYDAQWGIGGNSNIALIGGEIEAYHEWSVKVNGVEAADQVNRFFSPEPSVNVSNDATRSLLYIQLFVLPLPVVLKSFSASKELNQTVLNWATTEESNSRHFEIQRSPDAKQWSAIGIVTSEGESKELNNYTLVDPTPFAGSNYYRLKMVDNDDSFAYSKIEVVNFPEFSQAWPNPTSGVIHLSPTVGRKIKAAQLWDMSGKLVKSFELSADNTVHVGSTAGGLYLMKILQDDNSQVTSKIVVNK
ncbi:T9SS type A sorting domain-containing protein [Dyadobacter endophyticus]|uniref:Secretion system C-terminal sorting domain-containing protein n=1 Tax=Dyadobacter endophyticus TaxID=1749036 RepID=A0ABQ1Z404_9BACT|nr:T9SS type A sorting domain-containing protein [Dyadobacter endophyticus]GGH49477.1 hypothetical protein GCM10007423_51490 [Dyadobacter endophyticus]